MSQSILGPTDLFGSRETSRRGQLRHEQSENHYGAAAPLGTDIESACLNRLGCTVKQGWGMSELSPLGTVVPDDGIKPGSGSIGPVVSSTEAKIVNVETREMVQPGENGELLIRGPQVMKGYLNAPDKTAECLDADGWLSTGDIAEPMRTDICT